MEARAVLIGVNNLQKKFDAIATADLEPLMDKATLIVEAQAKKLAPVDDGLLRASIHPKVTTDGSKIIGTVYTACEYAPYVEFGTGIKGKGTYPYTVKGLRLKYRSTPWVYPNADYGRYGFTPTGKAKKGKSKNAKNATAEFFTTSGHVAQPFMYPALDMNKDRITRMMRAGYKQLLNEAVQ